MTKNRLNSLSMQKWLSAVCATFFLVCFSTNAFASCEQNCPCEQGGKECPCDPTSFLNRVVHFEIQAEDPEKMVEFYQTVFGWEIQKWDNPDHDYWLVLTGGMCQPGGINGGIMRRMGPRPVGGEPMSGYVCTIAVSSVDEYMEKITEAGGAIAMQPMTIPDVGTLAYCTDIDGNVFGIMQSI